MLVVRGRTIRTDPRRSDKYTNIIRKPAGLISSSWLIVLNTYDMLEDTSMNDLKSE